MRVVAGSARGIKLSAVPGHGTRPILDRVKTSLFDILRPRIEGTEVLDLFAGSGSVGIEALSQGAAACTFIDSGDKAISTIRKNLAVTGLSDRAEVRHADAFVYLRGTRKTFDLIYIAPPQYKGLWVAAMHRIAERPELLRGPSLESQARRLMPQGPPRTLIELLHGPSPGSEEGRAAGLAIVQIDPKEYESLDLGVIHETRQKRYGNSLLVFFERSGSPTSGSSGEGGIAPLSSAPAP
jgi:16S rRNA (guanine(966)-N(2))-methyltransferase RsmD